jgi:hypothetical protein
MVMLITCNDKPNAVKQKGIENSTRNLAPKRAMLPTVTGAAVYIGKREFLHWFGSFGCPLPNTTTTTTITTSTITVMMRRRQKGFLKLH